MTALKAAGLLLIVLSCTACGLRFAQTLRTRRKKLAGFYVFIGEIADRIRVGEQLRQIFRSDTACGLIEPDGYSARVVRDGLQRQDIKLLEDFFSALGLGDTASQVARCETYRELVAGHQTDAAAQEKAKARLYSLLGFFAGLFAATMLL